MPGFLLDESSTVSCAHFGTASPQGTPLPVTVDGQAAIGLSTAYSVKGCPFVAPAPGPCTSAQWVTGATRVSCHGEPLVLQDSMAICAPTGSGLVPLMVQARVTAV